MNNLTFLIFTLVIFIRFAKAINRLDLHLVEDNAVITSESQIRECFVNLLNAFNISGLVSKSLNTILTIHNGLLATALQDQENFRAIIELTRLNFSNVSEHFIKSVNEIANEDIEFQNVVMFNNSIIENITEQFLNELDHSKKVYSEDIDLETNLYKKKIFNNNIIKTLFNSSEDSSEEDKENVSVSLNETNRGPRRMVNRRVYKGKRTKIKYFPFLASVQILEKFYCAGSILSADIIITAASCLQKTWNEKLFRENPTFLSVRVGSTSASHGGSVLQVSEVYINPTYSSNNLKDNLCLLKLATPLKFGRKVGKINYDGRKGHLSKKNGAVTIVRWGSKNRGNKTSREHLSYAKLKILSLDKCTKAYPEQHIKKPQSFCTGSSKAKGACEHDIGDPGLVNGVLTGVVSIGSSMCGHSHAPTVFTKLGYYSHWIEDIIIQSAASTKSDLVNKTMKVATEQTGATSDKGLVTIATVNAIKQALRKTVSTKIPTNIYKVTDFPDSGQPPPIYIADGVKSLLYKNEYNIYLGTENPKADKQVGRENKGTSQPSGLEKDSDETSKTIRITKGPDVDSLKETKSYPTTRHTKKKKHSKSSKVHKHKHTSKITTKFKPNLLMNWETGQKNLMNKSIAYMDMIREKTHGTKTNKHTKHSKHYITTSDKTGASLSTHKSKNTRINTSGKVSTDLKPSVYKDLKEFLKMAATSKNPVRNINIAMNDESLKEFLQRMTGKTTKDSDSKQGSSEITTLKDFNNFETPEKITSTSSYNSTLYENSLPGSVRLNNKENVNETINSGKYTENIKKNSEIPQLKAIYDEDYKHANLKNNYHDEEFHTEEILNDYIQKATPKTVQAAMENYDSYEEENADKIISHFYALASQNRQSRAIETTSNNMKPFIKSDKSVASVVNDNFRRIATNSESLDKATTSERSNEAISNDYIYGLIDKAVDEVALEEQTNN